MPLVSIEKLLGESVKLAQWLLSESEEELKEEVGKIEIHQLNQRKTTFHRKEYLAGRILLKKLGVDIQNLKRTEHGALHCDKGFCSISHSNGRVVAAFSMYKVGVDIEKIRTKITSIAPRVFSKREMNSLDKGQEMKQLTQFWAAKEAMYKAIEIPGLVFKEEIKVNSSTGKMDSGEVIHMKQKHLFKLYSTFVEDFALCIAQLKEK